MQLLADSAVSGKKILVRLDLDLTDRELSQGNHPRVTRTVQTLSYLLSLSGSVTILAHRGRPEGDESALSLRPFVSVFTELLGEPVVFCQSLESGEVAKAHERSRVVLLENLRFHPEEEENDPSFASSLARLGDCYVFEAFGVSHRKHASVVSIPHYMNTYVGFNFAKEIEVLSSVRNNPARPLVALIGGSKLETKLPFITQMCKHADATLIGGKLLEEKLENRDHLISAQDVVIAKKEGENFTEEKTIDISSYDPQSGYSILDIGVQTIKKYEGILKGAKTIVWNGPLGLNEDPRFAHGTDTLARFIAGSSGYTVIGGGETLESVADLGLLDKISHVSLGGGAMLEFLINGTVVFLQSLNK